MNRRDALKTIGLGMLALLVRPAPRPRIDLTQFCARRQHSRYEMRTAYELNDWTYATDARCCVRVPPQLADARIGEGKMPPFLNLPWDHHELRGWKPMRALEPIRAANMSCSRCEGYGYEGTAIAQECETCGGTGNEWVGSHYDVSHPITCRTCKGFGHLAPPGAITCLACSGEPYGTFPALVQIDGHFFDAERYRKLQALGGDYVIEPYKITGNILKAMVPDGGQAMLVDIARGPALENIRIARDCA